MRANDAWASVAPLSGLIKSTPSPRVREALHPGPYSRRLLRRRQDCGLSRGCAKWYWFYFMFAFSKLSQHSTSAQSTIQPLTQAVHTRTSRLRLSSRVDQLVQLLRPVLIDILQDVVLLDCRVAIAHSQITLAEIVISLTLAEIVISSAGIRLQSNCLFEGFESFVQFSQLQISLAHVVRRARIPRLQH